MTIVYICVCLYGGSPEDKKLVTFQKNLAIVFILCILIFCTVGPAQCSGCVVYGPVVLWLAFKHFFLLPQEREEAKDIRESPALFHHLLHDGCARFSRPSV